MSNTIDSQGTSLLKMLGVSIPIVVISVIVFGYVTYHDSSIDAERYVSNWSCDHLEKWLDTEGKKFRPNIFKPSVEDSFNKKCNVNDSSPKESNT